MMGPEPCIFKLKRALPVSRQEAFRVVPLTARYVRVLKGKMRKISTSLSYFQSYGWTKKFSSSGQPNFTGAC